MRRLFCLVTLPLLLLACLYTPDARPDLHWLSGAWHDPDHPSTRLIWTRSPDQGVLGLLTSESQTLVISITSDGLLNCRNLGPHLTENSPLQQEPLLSHGPQELHYRNAHLSHLSPRTDSDALQFDWKGDCWRLQRDP